MTRGASYFSTEDVAERLNARARLLWGERRTIELQGAIEDTARILVALRRNPPDRNVEPGFYP